MNMVSILLAIHVVMAITLIVLILLQHGKGADAGAAFGSGASSTVFGASGSTSFFAKATAVLALVFFSNSFLLAYMGGRAPEKSMFESDKAMMEVQDIEIKEVEDVPDIPGVGDDESDIPEVEEGADGDQASDAESVPADAASHDASQAQTTEDDIPETPAAADSENAAGENVDTEDDTAAEGERSAPLPEEASTSADEVLEEEVTGDASADEFVDEGNQVSEDDLPEIP